MEFPKFILYFTKNTLNDPFNIRIFYPPAYSGKKVIYSSVKR